MYYLKRHFTFAGGHRLSKHMGRCFSLHGHNYDVWVTLRSSKLDENDMVIDFSKFKEIVNVFIDEFDHCLLINETDQEMIEPLKEKGMRVMVIGAFDPTAEKMAEQLFIGINVILKAQFKGIEVDQVEIFENVKSSAIYRED